MKGRIKIDKENVRARVEPEMFGSFIEHIGRSVYGGIYEPEHPLSDGDGFRTDVLRAVKELGVTCVRYPGGNFLSGYDWKDGIGPKESRPPKLELAWKQLEPNTFGTDEFMRWSKKTGIAPIMAVNMGTGTPKEAGELTEYCNHDGQGVWAALRRNNASQEPYRVKNWCVGNEMDGNWQICSMSPDDYAAKACEAAKIMRWIDPEIRLIVCGSSSPLSPTCPEWDRKILEALYEQTDFLSLHVYYTYNQAKDLMDFLACPTDLDRYIQTIISVCDYVKALKRGSKDVHIAIDEWNVWHNPENHRDNDLWTVGPGRLENCYDMADALVVAGLLCTLINHSDRVKIACFAQLVNVIAPIFTQNGGGMFKQTIFHPIAAFANNAAGTLSLSTWADIPVYRSQRFGDAPYIRHAVCYDPQNREYLVFAVNAGDAAELLLEFTEATAFTRHIVLKHPNISQKNSFDAPNAVSPVDAVCASGKNKVFSVDLDAKSFSFMRFSAK